MSSDEESDLCSDDDDDDGDVAPRPKTINTDFDVADFMCHPSTPQLTTIDMDGYLTMYRYTSGEEAKRTLRKRLSRKPLRCASYTKDANGIFVAGKSGSFRLFDIGQEKCCQVLMSKECPAYSVCTINQNLVAIGDDNGTLKIWDIRKGSTPIMEEDRSHDFISCLAVDKHGKFLFATSGDGTMSTFNVKRRKFLVQSENAEYDMSCVTVVKNNKKVVVGSSDGLLLLYNWEEFAAPSDRFPGHPTSVESFISISEDIMCTGAADGIIRAVHILPNRFLGVVGEHRDLPVNKISVSHDKNHIASSASDSVIKFWNVDHLFKASVDANAKPSRMLKTKKLVKSGVSGDRASFLSDLDKDITVPTAEMSDSESSDEND